MFRPIHLQAYIADKVIDGVCAHCDHNMFILIKYIKSDR